MVYRLMKEKNKVFYFLSCLLIKKKLKKIQQTLGNTGSQVTTTNRKMQCRVAPHIWTKTL